jgi:UDP-GlcNAc:undecaprenyl-phosphate/decaprenyl-phosphate GlcNAc-1-phosphate transferase
MSSWSAIVAALGLSLVATPAIRAVARKRGFLAWPQAGRWHSRPTPILGGIAVLAATTAAAAFSVPAASPPIVVLIAATWLVALVGLADDLRGVGPRLRLLVEGTAALAVVLAGVRPVFTGWATLDAGLSVLWLVGAANAFNLVDNIDGACAGLATIAAVGVVVLAASGGGAVLSGVEPWSAALCGALAGFLVYNAHPASVFLGDSGSLPVGFLVAGLALASLGNGQPGVGALVSRALLLAIPMLDAAYVSITRARAGRPVTQGGTDHLAHRLVASGLSDVQAVLVLAVGATLAAAAGLAVALGGGR